MLKILPAFIAALLAACTSIPLDPQHAEIVTASAMGERSAEASAELTIIRDSGGTTFNIPVSYGILVDDVPVGNISAGQLVRIFVKPGLHSVQILRRGNHVAGIQVTAIAERDVVLHAGESLSAGELPRIFIGETEPIAH